MFYQIIVFVLLTTAGILICRRILKIPKLSMKKNIKNLQVQKEDAGARLLNKFARLTHVCNYMECKFVKQLKSLK